MINVCRPICSAESIGGIAKWIGQITRCTECGRKWKSRLYNTIPGDSGHPKSYPIWSGPGD